MKPYFVSRQIVWPEGTPVVEIAGHLDIAGPDMLGVKFKSAGEGGEFDDPREAAAAAIRVRDLWWKAKAPQLEGWEKIEIRYQGSALIAAEDGFESDAALEEWAEKTFENLLKCAECGEPIYREKWYADELYCDDAFACCSERCAEKHTEGVADAEG